MDYEEFRKQLTHKVEEKLEWKELATFVPNKALPVYNWFYYKEGFAKELVEKLIEIFDLKEGDTVLDPFCGSGTTLVACRQNNINAIGLDVLPTAVFASKVKITNYNPEELRGEAKILFRSKFHKLQWDFPKIMRAMINKYALDDIAFFSDIIDGLKNKDFFTLALLNASIKVSWAWKDGGVIKIKRHPTPPLRKLFQRVVYRMIRDVEQQANSASVSVMQEDARTMNLPDNSIDAIITSPPYLNNIDYTKLYAIEDFFMKMRHVPSVRSFMGIREDEEKAQMDMDAESIYAQSASGSSVSATEAYFNDIKESLQEMHRVCKPGAHVAIVVGNAYLGREVESDFIISHMAGEIGFEVEKIYVLNKRFALENRTEKKGVLRESLIILKKH